MSQCNLGEKATVRYQFSGQEKKVYVSPQAPVVVTVQVVENLTYEFVGYRCNYTVDDVDADTGQVTSTSIRIDDNSNVGNPLIYCPIRYIYPPFEYPVVEWYGETGFSQYCRFQEYGILIKFSNEKRERMKAYFSLGGGDKRASRPNSRCYLDYAVRDVYFTRANEEHINFKYEIKIVNGDGSVFKDYGNKSPVYSVDCGDCPPNYIRCDTPDVYPGYSCIPCSEFVNEIKNIRSLLPNYR